MRYENGNVVLSTTPFHRLKGLHLHFIDLDGSFSLVLSASSATVNATAGTLTWPVAEQPWESGDQLMLRITSVAPPAVEISDLVSAMEEGGSNGFEVSAAELDTADSYSIRVTVDSGMGFDDTCTDMQEDETVTSGSATHSVSLTLHGCTTPGGTVTATLLIGGTAVATASQDVAVTLPNTAASGVPTIGGTVQVGQTLTAATSGITDSDRLTNVSYRYQWVRSDGTIDTDIAGATGSTYTLAATDEGKTIKVRVSFADDEGNAETLTSEETAEVAVTPVWSVVLTVVDYYGGDKGATSADQFANESGAEADSAALPPPSYLPCTLCPVRWAAQGQATPAD